MLALAQSAAAQSAPSDSSIVGRPLLRVDLTDIRQSGRSGTDPNFADFLRNLIILQLKSLRGIEIAATGQGLQCLGRVTTKQTGIATQAAFSGIPMVVVSALVTPDSRRTLIELDMTSCRADTVTRLRHSSEEIQGPEPLSQLLVLVETIARTIDDQIPRATIAISTRPPKPLDSLTTYLSDDAADRISQRLERQSDLRVIDSPNGSEVDYALATNVRVISPGMFEGRSVLTLRGSPAPVDSIVMRGRSATARAFANTFADSTVSRFAYWRHLGDVGAFRRGEPLSDSAIDARARRALCLDAPPSCQPDPSVALFVLDSAISRKPTASRYLLMGRAERLRENNAGATSAFRNALRAPALSRPIEAEVLSALVTTLRETGENTSAIDHYRRLVELFPMDSMLARESALNLRLASRRIMSLRALASLVRAYPGWSLPTSDFEAVLRGLAAHEAADSAAVIAGICLKTQSLVSRCYTAMTSHANIIANGTDWPEYLRSTALALVSLAESTPSRVAESHAYLALSMLGSISLVYESPGRVKLQSDPKVVLDSVSRPLDVARRNADQSGDSTVREWILRLRAQYALMTGSPDDAYVFAMRADSLFPSIGAKRLAASAALRDTDKGLKRLAIADSLITPLLGNAEPEIYLLFIQLKHRLGQDTAARDALQRIYRASPTNASARWGLAIVCSEFIMDRPCGFRLWSDALAAGRVRNYGDTLNAVEAALGADSVETAAKWLGPGLLRPANVCRKAVAHLFGFWIAAARQDDGALNVARRQWNQALAAAKSEKDGLDNCWIFEGGKATMASREASRLSPARKTELLEMMRQIDPD